MRFMNTIQATHESVHIELSENVTKIHPQKNFKLEVSNNDDKVQQVKQQIQSLTKLSLSHIAVTEKSHRKYFVDLIVHETNSCEECKKIYELFQRIEFHQWLDKAYSSGIFDIFLLNIF